MLLFLMRHGQSAWNVAGRVQGQASGNPLTSTGVFQASQAAMQLRGVGITRILSSDLERAGQTAQIVGEELGVPIVWEPALREQDAGAMTGRLASELEPQEAPEGLHINEVRWGGGESIVDVYARLARWWESLDAAPGERILIISHGIALQVLRAVLDGRGPRHVNWSGALANGGVVAIELDVDESASAQNKTAPA